MSEADKMFSPAKETFHGGEFVTGGESENLIRSWLDFEYDGQGFVTVSVSHQGFDREGLREFAELLLRIADAEWEKPNESHDEQD